MNPTPCQSRWGWHPCDAAALALVKEYHLLLLRAYRQYRARRAWERKTVRRLGPPPPACPDVTFRLDGRLRFLYETGPNPGNWVRTGEPGAQARHRDLYHWVLHHYRAARRPAPTPEAVVPLALPPDWAGHVVALRAWFAAPAPVAPRPAGAEAGAPDAPATS